MNPEVKIIRCRSIEILLTTSVILSVTEFLHIWFTEKAVTFTEINIQEIVNYSKIVHCSTATLSVHERSQEHELKQD